MEAVLERALGVPAFVGAALPAKPANTTSASALTSSTCAAPAVAAVTEESISPDSARIKRHRSCPGEASDIRKVTAGPQNSGLSSRQDQQSILEQSPLPTPRLALSSRQRALSPFARTTSNRSDAASEAEMTSTAGDPDLISCIQKCTYANMSSRTFVLAGNCHDPAGLRTLPYAMLIS